MCINTFTGKFNVIDVSVKNVNLHLKYVHFEGDKTYFIGHMIKGILHSWSFHMKFIKFAESLFN